MNGECVVCGERLVRGDAIGIVRCYVVHRRCATADATAKVGSIVAEARAAMQTAQTAQRRCADLTAELGTANYNVALAQADLRAARTRESAAGQIAAQRIAALEQDLATERRLRQEADLRAALVATTPTATPVGTAPEREIVTEPQDATAARFALLELD